MDSCIEICQNLSNKLAKPQAEVWLLIWKQESYSFDSVASHRDCRSELKLESDTGRMCFPPFEKCVGSQKRRNSSSSKEKDVIKIPSDYWIQKYP